MDSKTNIVLTVLCILLFLAAVAGWIVAGVALKKPNCRTSSFVSGQSAKKNPLDLVFPIITPGTNDTLPDENVDFFLLGRALSQPVTDDLFAEKSLCPFKVVVSATTSPIRLDTIRNVLSCLDPRSYDSIELNLPYKFGRTQQEYTINQDISTFPRLTIHRLQKDAGPVSKMLPTIERCVFPTVVISVDDDIAYDRNTIFKLLRALRIV